MKNKSKNIYLSLILIFLLISISINPTSNITAFYNGIKIWATIVVPALFPFFLFTKLLCELNISQTICKYLNPITKNLYNCEGVAGYIFFSSIISGYPVGAKLVNEFYSKNLISNDQAYRIVTFTSTSGPLFIIGTIGIGMFSNKNLGIVILLSHLISALINGLIYRKYKLKNNSKIKIQNINQTSPNILNECMINSIKSILLIGGYISIFFLITNIISTYNLFYPITSLLSKIVKINNLDEILSAIFNGLIEVTQGCLNISNLNLSPQLSCIICTGLVSFGGFSIHMQAYSFLKSSNIKYSFFLLQKTTHTIISIIIACVASHLIL